jgi:protein-S-isoprenylcysteine O-methyltransferase Ste14
LSADFGFMTLQAKAWFSLAVVGVVVGALIFVPAGTLRYWEAWVFLFVFFAAGALITAYLVKRDPALLERRMRGGPTAEKEVSQRVIVVSLSLGFVALLVVSALDHRFGWSDVPVFAVLAGDVLVAVGCYLILLVYRANTYASARIEVEAGQQVISTGPYATVRHPMYASALVYLLGTPIALGSYWGLLGLAAIVPALIWRLIDEERVLALKLPGYREYQDQVRHRLIPFIW